MRDFYHYFLYQQLVIIPVCYMSWTHVLAVRESGAMEGDEIWEVQRLMSDAIIRIINGCSRITVTARPLRPRQMPSVMTSAGRSGDD